MAIFEEQLKTLESVVERLERGDLPLEDSLSLFEQGVKLADECKAELEKAEGRIQVLMQRGQKTVAEDLNLEEND